MTIRTAAQKPTASSAKTVRKILGVEIQNARDTAEPEGVFAPTTNNNVTSRPRGITYARLDLVSANES